VFSRGLWRRFLTTAACSTTALLLLPTSARASSSPVISSITTSAGTFVPYASSYGEVRLVAGHGSDPQLSIDGVAAGDHLVIWGLGGYYGSGNEVQLAECDVTASSVVVNGTPSGCSVASTFSLPLYDGSVTLVAEVGSVRSPAWWYFRDNVAPYSPEGGFSYALTGGGIAVSWSWPVPQDTSPSSGMRSQTVYRSAPDPIDPASAAYAAVAVLDARLYMETGCRFDQQERCQYFDHPPAGHRYLYRVVVTDLASNTSAASPSLPTKGPDAAQGMLALPDQPVITAVSGDTSSPAYGTALRPSVAIAVGPDAGTVALRRDGTTIATKTFSDGTSVTTLSAGDYTGFANPRSQQLAAVVTVNGVGSTPSSPFTYVRPPGAPAISQVDGQARPARGTAKRPGVLVTGTAAGDVVTLYADDDCTGPHTATQVATNNSAPGATALVTAYSQDLALGTSCLSATTTDPSIAHAATATSARSSTFAYERKQAVKGFELGSHGGVRDLTTGNLLGDSPHFAPALARRLVTAPSGTSGYVLDGYGGLHPLRLSGPAAAPTASGAPYFGWDIARGVALLTPTSGYVLDGFGGVHAFGGAPAASGAPYFGWDIARDVVLLADGSGGYVLDGRGGIHGFSIGTNARPAPGPGNPIFTSDMARRMVLRTATSGYVLDGFGGVHAFGGAPSAPATGYHGGSVTAQALTMTELDGNGGYVVDASGSIAAWGDSLPLSVGPFAGDSVRDGVFVAAP
jgi:hypothetical protein